MAERDLGIAELEPALSPGGGRPSSDTSAPAVRDRAPRVDVAFEAPAVEEVAGLPDPSLSGEARDLAVLPAEADALVVDPVGGTGAALVGLLHDRIPAPAAVVGIA